MTKLWPNKGNRKCRCCGAKVPHQEGWSYRDDLGWHSVCRSRACAEKLGLEPEGQEAEKTQASTAALDGASIVVRTPPPWEMANDPRPLLRALPGARWDRQVGVWRCSARDEDRARVVELLERLGCEFDASLRETAPNPEVDEALARADQIPTLRQYQRDGIKWLAGRTNALLGDDMGLGKTLQTLVALPQDARAVVVCPKSLKYTWRDEGQLWRPDLQVTALAGRGSFRVPEEREIVVTNFDILPTPEQVAKLDLAGVVLIIDEAVAVKSFQRLPDGTVKGSARAKRVNALALACPRVWLLTGTPLANRPPDLYGLLNAGGMAEEAFGHFGQFMRAFGAYKTRYGLQWGQPDASVPEKLRRIMIRRKKSEVLSELPTKQYQWLHVNGTDRKLVKALDEFWCEWGDAIQSGALPPFELFSELRARLAESRVGHAVEIAEQYEDAGRPLVVFSAHRAPVDAFLAREGWAVITGDTPAAQRADIVKRFQGGGLKGVAITIAAGGTGLTLTAADTVLFVDQAWRPTDNAQAEDRICRIGQTSNQCHVIRMVSDHVLDQHVCRLLAEKQALIENAVEKTYQYEAPTGAAETAPMFEDESAEELAARIAAIEAAEQEVTRQEHQDLVERICEREIAKAQKRYGTAPEVEMTEARREAVRNAYRFMLSRCDGAQEEDGIGFNKPDAAVAHQVARFDLDSDVSLRSLCLMLRRYPGQIKRHFPEVFA